MENLFDAKPPHSLQFFRIAQICPNFFLLSFTLILYFIYHKNDITYINNVT